MKKTAFPVPSSDGVHTLAGVVYEPDGAPKGILHVVHGMAEHISRYDGFMTACCEDGFLVCGYDHLGHGGTVKDDSELGFIAPKDGWKLLVKDTENFREAVEKAYGALPYLLFGHSMGSFVVRLASVMNRKPDKLIVMGTGGPNPAAGAGIAMAGIIGAFKGKNKYSKFIDDMAFGKYNERFKDDPEPDKFSWLSVDKENRKKYIADKYSGFPFSVGGMKDLVTLNKKSCEKSCIAQMDKSVPVLLVSGANDPVGGYGEGVKKVYEMMKAEGVPVEMKLYEGARHEILNDFCKEEVIKDVLAFLNK